MCASLVNTFLTVICKSNVLSLSLQPGSCPYTNASAQTVRAWPLPTGFTHEGPRVEGFARVFLPAACSSLHAHPPLLPRWLTTQGPSNPQSKVIFEDLSTFGDKCPRNGSKTDTMVPRTTLECPTKGLAWRVALDGGDEVDFIRSNRCRAGSVSEFV